MLVLSRKQEEQIRIGDEIVVTVLRIKGNTVKIGIDAPRSVRVVRTELPPAGEGAETSASAPEATATTAGPVAGELSATAAAISVMPSVRRASNRKPLGRFESVIAQAIAK